MAASDMSEPISIRLPAAVLSEVETIASATERTRSWIIVRALRRYLATEGAEILDAIEGRKAIVAGEGHDLDEIASEIEQILRSGKAA